jgi:hypothetical protein
MATSTSSATVVSVRRKSIDSAVAGINDIPVPGSVEEVVIDPIACGFLRLFTGRQFNSENLQFWVTATQYKTELFEASTTAALKSQEEITKAATSIFNTFCADASDMQICLPAAVSKDLDKRMKSPKFDTFDQCITVCLKTMKVDVWPRFVLSDEFAQLCFYTERVNTGAITDIILDDTTPLPTISIADKVCFHLRVVKADHTI